MENLFYLIPLSGLLAVVFGLMRSKWISEQNPGNEKMQEIGLAIRQGATAFLVREYKILTIFVLTVAALLYWVNISSNTTEVALSFIVGAICSGLAGALGMRVATLANHRTTEAASNHQALYRRDVATSKYGPMIGNLSFFNEFSIKGTKQKKTLISITP